MNLLSAIWVGRAYNDELSQDMNALMRNYFLSGKTRLDLAEAMGEHFTSSKVKNQMERKWMNIADTAASRVAEMGHLSGYEDAGIEYVQIVAVLDSNTSPICRHLNGRKIPVSVMSQQRDALLEAAARHDIEATKRLHPMSRKDSPILVKGKTSEILDGNIGMLPYHFRCRTTTVAYFEPATYREKVTQMAIDGEVPIKEAVRLVDFARNAQWTSAPQLWKVEDGGDGQLHPSALVHFKKHYKKMGLDSLTDYTSSAMNLIRGSTKRDIYLVVGNKRLPEPQLYFHDIQTNAVVMINIDKQRIATYHIMGKGTWERRQESAEIFVKLEGGIIKWIKSIAF